MPIATLPLNSDDELLLFIDKTTHWVIKRTYMLACSISGK